MEEFIPESQHLGGRGRRARSSRSSSATDLARAETVLHKVTKDYTYNLMKIWMFQELSRSLLVGVINKVRHKDYRRDWNMRMGWFYEVYPYILLLVSVLLLVLVPSFIFLSYCHCLQVLLRQLLDQT